ncbi:MAG: ATP-binding protein [Gemmatimonadaceae bacterium]
MDFTIPPVKTQVLPRLAQQRVQTLLAAFPVVIVMGPRQAGKSTLVRTPTITDGRAWYTLDDLVTRDRAQREPDSLLDAPGPVTVDEVQREPEMLLAIKRAVDGMGPKRQRGKFLLTGSANLLTMKRVADSLAGRAFYVDLWPLTRQERLGNAAAGSWSDLLDAAPREWESLIEQRRPESAKWRHEVRRGGFPEAALVVKDENLNDWFEGYARTYLERDLRDLAAVENLVDFRRLLSVAALRVGQLVNQTDIGRDVKMSQQRVSNYLNLLETSYQIVRLPPFTESRTTRLIKTPKLYWNDPGLALYLSGLDEPTGSHLENMVLCDLLAWRTLQTKRTQIMYWRTATQLEVDFVIERGERLLPVEVKTSRSLRYGDAKALQAFLGEYSKRAQGGLVLYDGDRTFWLADRVLATPWWRVM